MITADDLTQIADDICMSLFTDSVPEPGTADEGPTRMLSAIVDIKGDWNGSVSVSCQRSTAVGIASVMFDMPGGDLSGGDVIDALGELANMAGGAVKGMIDGEKSLGLPTVGEGIDFVMVVPGTTEVASVDYDVASGGTLRLGVFEVRG